MKIKNGHTVYEVNATGIVTEAVYAPGSIFISAGPTDTETSETMLLKKNPGCKYFTALNIKNAIRKVNKQAI